MFFNPPLKDNWTLSRETFFDRSFHEMRLYNLFSKCKKHDGVCAAALCTIHKNNGPDLTRFFVDVLERFTPSELGVLIDDFINKHHQMTEHQIDLVPGDYTLYIIDKYSYSPYHGKKLTSFIANILHAANSEEMAKIIDASICRFHHYPSMKIDYQLIESIIYKHPETYINSLIELPN